MTPSPSQFKPLVGLPTVEPESSQANAPAPEPSDNAYPNEILQMWQKIYFAFPSPGLKKRVQEVQAWAEGNTQ